MSVTVRRLLIAIALLLAVPLLVGCDVIETVFSEPSPEPEVSAVVEEPNTVTLAGQTFDRSLDALTLPEGVTAAEIAFLSDFAALAEVDASAVQVTPELLAAADAFPAVRFTWGYLGVPINENTESLDLSNRTGADVQTLVGLLDRFGNIVSVDLTGTDINADELYALTSGHPGTAFRYTVDVFGTPTQNDAAALVLASFGETDTNALIDALKLLPSVETVDLGGQAVSGETLSALGEAYPEIAFLANVTVFGRTVPADTTSLDLQNMAFSSVEEVRSALSALPKLAEVDMRGCNLTDEELGSLQDAFPNTTFIWIIHVGAWEIRTDITAFSKGQRHSFPNGMGFFGDGKSNFYSEDCEPLKYCKNLEHLDLGHGNRITDLSFLTGLTKLRTLILSMNKIEDITPLTALTNLELLEIYQNLIVDLTPLTQLPKLEYLNISRTSFRDITPLTEMKQLKMLWLVNTRQVTPELRAELEAALPDCEFCYKASTSSKGGWLKNPLYREYQRAYGLKFYDD